MSVSINQNGVWIDVEKVHINENGTWREVQDQYVNNLSTWRRVIPDVGGIWVWGNGASYLTNDYSGYEDLYNTLTNSAYSYPYNKYLTPLTTFAGGGNWKEISVAPNMLAAIDTDGYLWTAGWRWNVGVSATLGRIDESASEIVSPIKVGYQQSGWELNVTDEDNKFSTGFYHSAAIKTDGTLWLWGTNMYSVLGNGQIVDSDESTDPDVVTDGKIAYTPVTTFAGGTDWKQVSCGRRMTAAVKTDGTLWTWGWADQTHTGRLLGIGSTPNPVVSTPVTTFAGGTDWKQVSCGQYVTAAVKTDGTLWVWGRITSDTLASSATGGVRTASTPVTTFVGGTNWKQVSVGDQDGIAAIKTDGTLWTWEQVWNTYTGLIEDTNHTLTYFRPNISGGTKYTTVLFHSHRRTPVTTFAGGTNWMAYNSDGFPAISVYNNTATSDTIPHLVTYQAEKDSVTNSTGTAAAIKTDGTLWVWGDNRGGQLGIRYSEIGPYAGSFVGREYYPTPVTTFAGGTNWKQVSVGNNYMMAVKTDGTLWTWGFERNNRMSGSLPNPSGYGFYISATEVSPGTTDWKQVSSSTDHTAAVKTDGTLWTWGNNFFGQAGQGGLQGTSSLRNPNTTFVGGTDWKQVSCGYTHTAAIKTDGTLWVWGVGPLGVNNYLSKSTPVTTFAGGTNWSEVTCGQEYTIARKTDGTVWTWGSYQRFSGTASSASANTLTPVEIKNGGNNWSTISENIGLKTDGTLWVWGGYTWVTGGSNDREYDYSVWISYVTTPFDWYFTTHPISLFGGATNWAVVASSARTVNSSRRLSIAVKTDGTLWTWGDNHYGQLGIGKAQDTTYSDQVDWTSPVNYHTPLPNTTFIGGTDWKRVSVGSGHMSAIKTDGTLWVWGGFNSSAYMSYPVTGFTGRNRFSNEIPNEIENGGNTWKQVSCGRYATIAIKTDGTFWSWGDSRFNTQGGTASEFGSTAFLDPWDNILFTSSDATYSSYPTQRVSETDWNSVSLNARNGIGLKTDGTLWFWGTSRIESDLAPRMFNTTTFNASIPVWRNGIEFRNSVALHKLPGTWKTCSVAENSGAAIKPDGTLWVWGTNMNGKLGNNTSGQPGVSVNYETTPITTFAGGTDWKQVAVSYYHVAAVKTDGTLWVWGDNTYGQLGTNDNIERSIPVTTFAGGNDWKKVFVALVSNAYSVTGAIKTDGTLWMWGYGGDGQLGQIDPLFNSYSTANRLTPVTTFFGGNDWKKISISTATAALKNNGTLWVWGNSQLYGAPSEDFYVIIRTPVTVFSGQNNWAYTSTGEPEDLGQFVAASEHSAAIRTDGTLWTWGSGKYGILGNNNSYNQNTPITTFAGGTNWKQIDATRDRDTSHMMGLKTDGTIWLWGNNSGGTLGLNNGSANVPTPVSLFVGGNTWKNISTSGRLSAAIKTDGTMWLWGTGNTLGGYKLIGELEHPEAYNSTPSLVPYGSTAWKVPDYSLPSLGVVHPSTESTFSVGRSGVMAIKTDGTLWTWGSQTTKTGTSASFPILGNYGLILHQQEPAETWSGGTDWKSVAMGTTAAFAIKTDGTLWSWGDNAGTGIIGNASYNTDAETPTNVYPLFATTWRKVDVGDMSAAAIKTDGSLWVWGNNNQHQLGIRQSIYVERYTPVTTYAGGYDWIDVSMGSTHCIGLKGAGSNPARGYMYTWGYNSIGELAYGSGSSSFFRYLSVPNYVGYDVAWINVSAGYRYSGAIRSDGTLWMWGNNYSGKLGVNSILPKSSPVTTFLGGNDWKKVRCGNYATAAIKTNGTLWLWGNGYYLGLNGDLTNRSIPVENFLGGNDWADVQWWQGGNGLFPDGHVGYAIKTNGDLYCWGGGASVNTSGYLLTGVTTLDKTTPHEVKGGGNTWKQVSLSPDFGAAIKTDGTLWTWGEGSYGRLGNNTVFIDCTTPITTFVGGTDWKQVSTGQAETTSALTGGSMAAIKTDGTLWTWGYNTQGQCGANNYVDRSVPNTTFAGGTDWKQVSVGEFYMSAVKTDGTLWVWGALSGNVSPTAFDGVVFSTTPIPITTYPGGNYWKQVSCGRDHLLALWDDGVDRKLYTLGVNADDFHIFGTNQLKPLYGEPEGQWRDIASGGSDVQSGRDTIMAITNSGELYHWGTIPFSNTGSSYYSQPVAFLPLQSTKWKSITGSYSFWAGKQSDF